MAKQMKTTPKRWRRSNYGKGLETTEDLNKVLDNFSPFVVSSLGRTRKWRRSAAGRKIKLLLEASNMNINGAPPILTSLLMKNGYIPLPENKETDTLVESSEETTTEVPA